jgi:hypothetical protein
MPPIARLPVIDQSPATLPARPPSAPPAGRFLSQSECSAALTCGLQWWGTWGLGYRPQYPETPAQRIGSMGHAALNDRVLARHHGRDPGPIAAADAERTKRGWGDWTPELEGEFLLAEQAANTLADTINLDALDLLPSPLPDGGPLAEVRLHVPWSQLARAGFGKIIDDLHHLTSAYSGIEGQPDIGLIMAGIRTCLDFKMRQRPDLGGAAEDSAIPDPQGAFYKVLLAAAGVHVDEFKQANVYAGPWLSLDDFMDEGSQYVRTDGLPSRDLNKLGAMVKADVWADAWRLLVERKRIAHMQRPVRLSKRTGEPLKGQEWEPPDDWDARQFIRHLETYPLVAVRSFRLDMSVCRDVVRDMLGAVDAHLAALAKGVTPSRHLRNFATSPCVRPFGCPVQSSCRASLGTGNAERIMREHAEAGALARLDHAPIGIIPAGVGQAR